MNDPNRVNPPSPLDDEAVERRRHTGTDRRYPVDRDCTLQVVPSDWVPAIPAGTTSEKPNSPVLPLDEEDQWRANTYGLLARLLIAPPTPDLLARLSQLPVPEDDASGQPLTLATQVPDEKA